MNWNKMNQNSKRKPKIDVIMFILTDVALDNKSHTQLDIQVTQQ